MQQGSSFLGSVYAPISYPPVPLLAFKVVPGSRHVRLAAAGALRSVDPDRLVIKKIVLSGTLGNEGVWGGGSLPYLRGVCQYVAAAMCSWLLLVHCNLRTLIGWSSRRLCCQVW